MDNKQARYLHRMLDRLAEGKTLNPQDVEALRKNLPELPKQKTLEEIAWDIHFAWCETSGNDWKEELFGDLETWLSEQHSQLRAHLEGVKSQAHPALPAGMRIADHEDYGRVVAAPIADSDGERMIFCLDKTSLTGAGRCWAHEDSLTFIDAEPAAPAHPEFLETEADYQKAPEGTIVALDDTETVWLKRFGAWKSTDGDHGVTCVGLSASRLRVLRWGWSK